MKLVCEECQGKAVKSILEFECVQGVQQKIKKLKKMLSNVSKIFQVMDEIHEFAHSTKCNHVVEIRLAIHSYYNISNIRMHSNYYITSM